MTLQIPAGPPSVVESAGSAGLSALACCASDRKVVGPNPRVNRQISLLAPPPPGSPLTPNCSRDCLRLLSQKNVHRIVMLEKSVEHLFYSLYSLKDEPYCFVQILCHSRTGWFFPGKAIWTDLRAWREGSGTQAWTAVLHSGGDKKISGEWDAATCSVLADISW